MPVSNKTRKFVATVATEKRYPTGMLLKSRHLSGYQQDFAKVILTKPEYTISEAVNALEMKLKGGQ